MLWIQRRVEKMYSDVKRRRGELKKNYSQDLSLTGVIVETKKIRNGERFKLYDDGKLCFTNLISVILG